MNAKAIVLSEEKNLTRPDFLALVDEIFGHGYHLSKNFSDKNYFCFLALHNTEIVGFCTGKIADAQLLKKLEIKHLASYKIGVLDMIGIKKEFRCLKIGTELFKVRQTKINELNWDYGIQLNWLKNNSAVPNLAIKHGYELLKTIPRFWSEESMEKNYSCEECGTPPCQCSCAVYIKKLRN